MGETTVYSDLYQFVYTHLSEYLGKEEEYFLADYEDDFREKILEEKNKGLIIPEEPFNEEKREGLRKELLNTHSFNNADEFIRIALRKIGYIVKTLDRKCLSDDKRILNTKFVYPTEENLKYTRAYQVSEGKYPDLKYNYTVALLNN